MLDRIVDQVGDRIEQQIPVAGDHHRLVANHFKINVLVFGGGIIEIDHRLGDFDKIHRAEPRGARRGLDLRNSGQRREHPQHVVKVGHGVGD
jgi:hypothetical protein